MSERGLSIFFTSVSFVTTFSRAHVICQTAAVTWTFSIWVYFRFQNFPIPSFPLRWVHTAWGSPLCESGSNTLFGSNAAFTDLFFPKHRSEMSWLKVIIAFDRGIGDECVFSVSSVFQFFVHKHTLDGLTWKGAGMQAAEVKGQLHFVVNRTWRQRIVKPHWNQSWATIKAHDAAFNVQWRLTVQVLNKLTPEQLHQRGDGGQMTVGLGKGGGRRKTDCAHFQSQGKSLAPVQGLCKWALLTDSPFGVCRGERQKEQKRIGRCDVKKSKSSYWNREDRSWQSRMCDWVKERRKNRAEQKHTPSRLHHREQKPADRQETAEHVRTRRPANALCSNSCARLTFKVQEKVWIVLYFLC